MFGDKKLKSKIAALEKELEYYKKQNKLIQSEYKEQVKLVGLAKVSKKNMVEEIEKLAEELQCVKHELEKYKQFVKAVTIRASKMFT